MHSQTVNYDSDIVKYMKNFYKKIRMMLGILELFFRK